ncbi:hypothetical protein KI387_036191, partial [Taxus chinensis]
DQTRDMLGNGGDIVLQKHKMRGSSLAPALAREDRGMSTERHRESEPSHLSPRAQAKRKADRDDFQMKDEDVQVKKRNIGSQDAANGFRERDSTVRLLNSSKAHYDDGNPVKRIVNGRRYMYDDDLSDNEQNFKRKITSHRCEISEEWDEDKYPDSSGRTSKNLRDRNHQNK